MFNPNPQRRISKNLTFFSARWIYDDAWLGPLARSHKVRVKKKYVLQGILSVLYCIKMWCMLNTPPRSTPHSAVDWPFAEIVHCPPAASRFLYCPSTALSDPQGCPEKECCSHVCLFNARFAVIQIENLTRISQLYL